MGNFGNPPTFADGQVLSATLHLNAVQRIVQGEHDKMVGLNFPFQSYSALAQTYRGYLRHKYNTLNYKIVISGSSDGCKLQINGQDVPNASHYGTGTYTQTGLDISSLGLIAGEFYEVTLNESRGDRVQLWHLAETYAPTYPTLADFNTTDTPTAAEWQELADYATYLDAVLSAPVPVHARTAEDTPLLIGQFVYYSPILSYHFSAPAPLAGGGDRWCKLWLEIDGSTAAYFHTNRAPLASPDQTDYYWEEKDVGDVSEYLGTIDLRDYANTSGLTVGSEYDIRVRYEANRAGEDERVSARVRRLYFEPLSGFTTSGWAAFTDWAHGDTVDAGGDPDIQTLPANLAELGSLALYRNYPALTWRSEFLYGVRRWRWLHYKNEKEDDSPELLYDYRGERRKVGMNNAYDEWQTIDLAGIEGLYPGVQYWLANTLCAIEDTTA